jgi:arabinogalactan endo-1,4-beta-galactosidase
VCIELELVEELKKSYNFITNGDFSQGLDGWNIKREDERIKIEIHPEFLNPFPAPPIHFFYVESPVNFMMEISKELDGLETGIYSLSVDYRGTNTTGVDVRLYAQANGNDRREEIIYPTDENWITYTLSDIIVTNGKLNLGLNIQSPPIFAKFRKVTLTRQNQDAQEE